MATRSEHTMLNDPGVDMTKYPPAGAAHVQGSGYTVTPPGEASKINLWSNRGDRTHGYDSRPISNEVTWPIYQPPKKFNIQPYAEAEQKAKQQGGTPAQYAAPAQGTAQAQVPAVSGFAPPAQRYPVATTTKSTTMPVLPGPAPEMGELPVFTAPEWDKRAVRAKQQSIAAPQLRQLRRQVQDIAGRHYDNPNVRRMVLRDALQGYGIGMGGVVAAAGRQAQAEYTTEYRNVWEGLMANFNTQVGDLTQRFNAAYNVWKSGIGQKTTQDTTTKYATAGNLPQVGDGGIGGTSPPVAPHLLPDLRSTMGVPLGGARSGTPGTRSGTPGVRV